MPASERQDQGTVAVLFTDIVSSTKFTQDHGDARSQVLVRGESGQTQVSFLRLRSLLGPNLLRSGRIQGTWPHPGKIIEPGGGWAVYGAGHGHGAGLCQTGTHLLAGRDWSATRILHHYFSGAVVRSLPLSGSRRP